MNNKLLKIFVFAFIMLCSFVSSAAEPGGDSDSGNLEDTDAPPASIDQNLLLLSISGISFAFICFAQKGKTRL